MTKRWGFVYRFLLLACVGLGIAAAQTDLTIYETHVGKFTRGQSGSYSINVSNIGNQDTWDSIGPNPVTVTVVVPTGLTAISINGPGWNCTQPAGPCDRSDNVVPNESLEPLTLTVAVDKGAPSQVISQSSVSNQVESISGPLNNNTATDPTLIIDPAPIITSVSPVFSPSCGPTLTITVNGSNFSPAQTSASSPPSSQVFWTPQSGPQVGLDTTYVNANQLTAIVPASLLAQPNLIAISVIQISQGLPPDPSSIHSNDFLFPVRPPTVVSLNPSVVSAGAPSFNLVVSGNNFVAGSSVMFGSSALATTFVNINTLNATVPASLIGTVGTFPISVLTACGFLSNSANLTVQTGPFITSLVPNSAVEGSPGFTLTVNGSNLSGNYTILWNGSPLTGTVSTTTNQLTAPVPAALIATRGTAQVQVGSGSFVSNSLPFTILPKLSITTTSLPGGLVGTSYSAALSGIGGVPPYTWGASGLPPGLGINASTGAITGIPTAAGTFTASITLSDNYNQSVSAQFPVTITGKLAITTASLPNGTVGVPYSAPLAGTGGVLPYSWSATGLPPGLNINPSTGTISGTPTAAGPFTISVTLKDNANQTATVQFAVTIVPRLTITTTQLPNGIVGNNYSATLTESGGISPFTWSATGLPAGLAINTATGAISGIPTVAGNASVTITLKDSAQQTATAQLSINVISRLTITSASLPGGNTGSAYFFQLTATGGTPPYTWQASNLPGGLSLNSTTGEITGTLGSQSTSNVLVTVFDSGGQTATRPLIISVTPPAAPALAISTPSPLPAGTAGTAYVQPLGASNGTPPYTFSVAGGTLPDGITLSSNGLVSGTPTTPGQYSFTAKVTDSVGGTATADFPLLIKPGPLSVTGTVSDAVVGTALSVKFGATGGVSPYTFAATGSLPAGTTFAADGTLSGTLTTAGTFTFAIAATDKAGVVASKSFTIKVAPPALTITTASLPPAQAQVAYSTQLVASGGVPPYTWTATGLPAGLSLSTNGVVSGTPTADGAVTIGITVTDSAGTAVTRSLALVVAPATLTISTTSLPNGTVGVAYQASITGSGGVPPYVFTITGLPAGINGGSDGALSGTPTTAGNATASVTITDSKGATATRSLAISVVAAPLVITTASLPTAVAGVAVSATMTATGGVAPLSWTATGLPNGLTLSGSGTLSGTTSTPGSGNVTVTVKDSAGTSVSKTFTLTVGLPPSPGLNLTGLPTTSNPSPTSQPRVGVGLGATYPVDVTVKLTLAFAADSGPDDQTVQFQSGGRTATIVVPAGNTAGLTDVGVQVGTVAGNITITAQLTAASTDITPTPAPVTRLRISPAAPVIVPPVTATRNSTGFTVNITGYSSTREVTQAIFSFTAASGSTLQTSQITVPIGTIFAPYFQSAGVAAVGSQFTYSQPFTVSGGAQSVVSVTVTLVNSIGNSAAVTANLQ